MAEKHETGVKSCEHHVVYRDAAYFAAWPFNGGMWRFADGEIALGFVRGRSDYDEETIRHGTVDRQRGEHMIIRSRDGGITWDIDDMTEVYHRPAFDEIVKKAPPRLGDGVAANPEADGFCLLAGFGIPPRDDQAAAWIIRSLDRGRSWSGPVRPLSHRFSFLAFRPGYCVREDGTVLIFGIGNTTDTATEKDAFPVVYASPDGGVHWHFLAVVEPQPRQSRCIMGDPLILRSGVILAAFRREYGHGVAYTQIYRSDDAGRSWRFLSRVNDWGAPANLVEMSDGRIVCLYGRRVPPYGIRGSISEDGGASWGREFVLRNDGGSGDIGYPRTVLNADGTLVTAYYFNDPDDSVQQHGGVRYIAATRWTVG